MGTTQVTIMDAKRDAKNFKRMKPWVESITFKPVAPKYTFDLDEDTRQLHIRSETPSQKENGDTVTLNVRVDLTPFAPASWNMILLETIMLMERHQVYEHLKVNGKQVYAPHHGDLSFRDDPPVSFEIIDD
jgi:hypothetical protein